MKYSNENLKETEKVEIHSQTRNTYTKREVKGPSIHKIVLAVG
jgi:phage tail tube protein FII